MQNAESLVRASVRIRLVIVSRSRPSAISPRVCGAHAKQIRE